MLLDLIKHRTSCRHYSERPVGQTELEYCLEAARWAPSACNQQPWRFVVVTNDLLRERLSTEGLLPGISMPWVKKAPVIIVLCAKKSLVTHVIAPIVSGVRYQLIDLGIAGEHLVLAAEERGLGTCWIGWFNAKAVRKILQLPRHLEPVSLLALGYPEEITPPRQRLELFEIAEFRS